MIDLKDSSFFVNWYASVNRIEGIKRWTSVVIIMEDVCEGEGRGRGVGEVNGAEGAGGSCV